MAWPSGANSSANFNHGSPQRSQADRPQRETSPAPQAASPCTSPRNERETDEGRGIKRSRSKPTTHSEPAFKKARSQHVVPDFDAVYGAFLASHMRETASSEDEIANWQTLLAQLDPQTLLRRFADPSAQSQSAANDCVAIACLLGYSDLMQEFARQGANLRVHYGHSQLSLLEIAVEGGHLPMVDFLLAKGLGQDHPRPADPLFHRACRARNWPIAQRLLETIAGQDMVLALDVCLSMGQETMARQLLERVPMVQNIRTGVVAMHYACKFGLLEFAQELKCRGIDPLASQGWYNGLDSAVRAGQVKMLDWLLELESEPDARKSLIQSALVHVCAECERAASNQPGRDVLALLLSLGADPYLGDEDGFTPLMYAAGNPNIDVDRMLYGGEQLNATNTYGYSALSFAVHAQREDLVDKLLDCGACPDSSAVERAAQLASPALLKRLHAAGGNLDLCSEDGTTPLMVAAGTGATEVLRYLLAQNQPVEEKDDNGSQALHYAAMSGELDAVKLLVEAGAPTRVAGAQ